MRTGRAAKHFSVAALTFAAGCSPGWQAVAGGKGAGYDVYRPEPYLLVVQGRPATSRPAAATAGAQPQQYTASILYLPDYSQRYRIRSLSGGTNILIKDGWQLTSLTDQNAASNLLSSALSAASPSSPGGGALGLLGLAGGFPLSASGSGEPDGPAPTPAAARPGASLFKIVYSAAGQVTGLVRVPMVEGELPRAGLTEHAPPPVPVYVEPK